MIPNPIKKFLIIGGFFSENMSIAPHAIKLMAKMTGINGDSPVSSVFIEVYLVKFNASYAALNTPSTILLNTFNI